MRRFVRFIFILLLIVFGAVLGVNYLLSAKKGDIANRVISNINQNLKGEINVSPEDIDITIIENFPWVSVRLSDVIVKGAYDTDKDLLKASSVYLLFNFVDFWNGKYEVSRLSLEDAHVYVEIDQEGMYNYDILKEEAGSSDSLSLKLDQIDLARTGIEFRNYSGLKSRSNPKQHILQAIESATIFARLNQDSLLLNVGGGFTSDLIKIKRDEYFEDVNYNLNTNLIIDFSNQFYTIETSSLEIDHIPIEIGGTLDASKDYSRIDLGIKTRNKEGINELFSVMRYLGISLGDEIKVTGKTQPNVKIKGILASWKNPIIEVDFKLENGAYYLPDEQTLDRLNLVGHFTNGNSGGSLSLDTLSFDYQEQRLMGDLLISDFSSPSINAELTGKVNLELLNSYFEPNELYVGKGLLDMRQVMLKMKLNNFKDFKVERLDFKSRIEGKGIDLRIDENYQLSDVDFNIQASNKAVIVNQLKGKLEQSDFEFDGIIYNVYQYIFDKINNPNAFNKLSVSGNLKSNNFDLNKIFQDSDNEGFVLPEFLDFNIASSIANFKFRQLEIQRLKLKLKKENSYVSFGQVDFDGMGGHVHLSGQMHQFESEDYFLSTSMKLDAIDIQEMMLQMEDFKQDVLTSKNLRGILDANGKLKLSFNPQFKFDLSALKFKGDVSVKKGELIDFKPLWALSKYVSVEELSNIKFEDLQNHLVIEREKIEIPQMIILSSAMDLSISGSHTFTNDMDYKIRMKFSELLSRKRKIRRKSEAEFNEKGEGSLYLTVKGNVSNPEVKYDRRAVRSKIKQDLRNEKSELKDVLNSEFGNQKPVTKIKDQKIQTEEIEFIDFDEN